SSAAKAFSDSPTALTNTRSPDSVTRGEARPGLYPPSWLCPPATCSPSRSVIRSATPSGSSDQTSRERPSGAILMVAKRLGGIGQHAVQITDDGQVRHLRQRGLVVDIDGDDVPGSGHSAHVVGCSGDPRTDVDAWHDRHPGLPDLGVVAHPSLVHA